MTYYLTAFIKALVMSISVVCLFALLEYLAWYIGLPLFPDFRQSFGRQQPAARGCNAPFT